MNKINIRLITIILLLSSTIASAQNIKPNNDSFYSYVSDHRTSMRINSHSHNQNPLIHAINVYYNASFPTISVTAEYYFGTIWANSECVDTQLYWEYSLPWGMQKGSQFGFGYNADFLPKNVSCGVIKVTTGGKTVVDQYQLTIDEKGNYIGSTPRATILEIND